MLNGCRKFHLGLLLAFVLFASGRMAVAQTTQQFTGHVSDTSGAMVPRAEVVVHNQGTGVDTRTLTTSQGVYTVPYLTPGHYTITVTKPGFKTEAKTDILLNVDQTSTIDFHLTVGAASETVDVNASNLQVELTKSDRGTIIDNELVTEMPLNGRNPYTLFGLAPGTLDTSAPQWTRPFDNVTDNQYANGAPQQPSVNLDGISNMVGGNSQSGFGTNAAIVPSVETVQEFKVVTDPVDASYGRGGAASIDVALKSGTNQFHGALDYFKRGDWLDAYDWESKFTASTNDRPAVKAPHNRNQWSVEADGPLRIPHVFNGKDRLFYMISYEEMLDVLPNGYSVSSLPDPNWATGDFSSMQYWNTTTQSVMPLNIYDPLTPLTEIVDPNDPSAGPKRAFQQFAGNIVPTSRIDPVGLNLLKLLAQVKPNNNPGPGYAPFTNNYIAELSENDIWRNAMVKVDYVLTNKDRLSFRWNGQGRWQHSITDSGYPNSVPFNMNGLSYQPKSEGGAVEWTHTFSPKLLFDLHTTLMSQGNSTAYGPPYSGNWLQDLGFASAFYSQTQNQHRFPEMYFDGVTNGARGIMGSEYGLGGSWVLHTLAFLPTVTWVHSQHTTRAGIDIQLQQFANPGGGNIDVWEFGQQFTNQFPYDGDAPGYASGSPWASALLGYPEWGQMQQNDHDFESQHYFAPWVQDDWKLTSKLTLNLGLRWDFQTPRVERHNKVYGPFNTTVINPVSASLPFNVIGGPEFAGVNGVSRAPFAMNWLDWQPRVGFVYAFRPTLSIRAGVAKNYLLDNSFNGTGAFQATTTYQAYGPDGLTPYTATTGQGLSNPMPSIVQPTGSSLGYLTNMGNGFTFMNPNYKIPSFWNYNVTLEAALTKRDVISVAYVGNIEPNGPVTEDINHVDPSFYQQCNGEAVGWIDPQVTWSSNQAPHHICDDNVAANTIGFETNPFQGIAAFSGSGYYTPSRITKEDPTRPYFGWWDINEVGANNNYRAYYNSLQLTADHQVSHSLSLHFNYTHATDITEGNFLTSSGLPAGTYPLTARQVSTTNQVKHTIKFSGVGYLPFGRGRALFSGVNRWMDELINGWEISPMLSYYSGFPWRPSGNWEINSNIPMGVDHKLLAPDSNHNDYRIRGVTPCVGYINSETGQVVPSPAAVEANCTTIPYVEAGKYAVPRNVIDFGVTQPGALHFDASLAKNFKVPGVARYLSDAANLQLRVDLLNALNHPTWDWGYDSNPADENWGTIQENGGPTNLPRYIQLSGKFSW